MAPPRKPPPAYTLADLDEARAKHRRAAERLQKALSKLAKMKSSWPAWQLESYAAYANGCTTTYSTTLEHLDAVEKQLQVLPSKATT